MHSVEYGANATDLPAEEKFLFRPYNGTLSIHPFAILSFSCGFHTHHTLKQMRQSLEQNWILRWVMHFNQVLFRIMKFIFGWFCFRPFRPGRWDGETQLPVAKPSNETMQTWSGSGDESQNRRQTQLSSRWKDPHNKLFANRLLTIIICRSYAFSIRHFALVLFYF